MNLQQSTKSTSAIIIILVLLAMGYIIWQNKVERALLCSNATPTPIPASEVYDSKPASKDIQVTTPLNLPLSGEATISGIARLVYFEASFPAHILDSNNGIVWSGPATATADWMTENYVPFTLSIPTNTIPNGNYTLKLVQDDPSGEIAEADLYSISLPIVIQN